MEDKKRVLAVPLNKQGMIDDNYGIESDNIKYVDFPAKEFDYMFGRLTHEINIITGVFIDDYEAEELTADECKKCYKTVEKHKDKIPVFWEMFNLAIEKNTLLATYC